MQAPTVKIVWVGRKKESTVEKIQKKGYAGGLNWS